LANLEIPAEHRVDPSLPGALGQIDRELIEILGFASAGAGRCTSRTARGRLCGGKLFLGGCVNDIGEILPQEIGVDFREFFAE
jgi:hypothetical protein